MSVLLFLRRVVVTLEYDTMLTLPGMLHSRTTFSLAHARSFNTHEPDSYLSILWRECSCPVCDSINDPKGMLEFTLYGRSSRRTILCQVHCQEFLKLTDYQIHTIILELLSKDDATLARMQEGLDPTVRAKIIRRIATRKTEDVCFIPSPRGPEYDRFPY